VLRVTRTTSRGDLRRIVLVVGHSAIYILTPINIAG
jgi:hypothetical protein